MENCRGCYYFKKELTRCLCEPGGCATKPDLTCRFYKESTDPYQDEVVLRDTPGKDVMKVSLNLFEDANGNAEGNISALRLKNGRLASENRRLEVDKINLIEIIRNLEKKRNKTSKKVKRVK